MKKKGFTLIELLAVIVILAVIALIATPLIMNVINDAKKNSFKDSAYGITKAVELKSMRERLTSDSPSTFVVDLTGTDLEYNGSKPKAGYAAINVSGDIALEMNDGTWCIKKGFTDVEVTITKLEDGCDGSSIQTLDLSTPTSNDSGNQGAFTGTVYSLDAKRTGNSIKLDDEEWCIVGLFEGNSYSSCDSGFSFSKETECQEELQNEIDEGFVQEGDMTCQKDESYSHTFTYKTNPTSLNFDAYFKYDVDNDIVTTSYVCYMADKEYCFNSDGSYSDYIQVLQSIEPWFNEHAGSCSSNSNTNFLLSISDRNNLLGVKPGEETQKKKSCELDNGNLSLSVSLLGVAINIRDFSACENADSECFPPVIALTMEGITPHKYLNRVRVQ